MNTKLDNDIENLSLKSFIMIVVSMAIIISFGTYAWLSYRSNETAMVLTIGNINNVEITLSPYRITSVANPVATYASEKYTNVTAINSNNIPRNFTLYYKINNIANELKIASFKYTIERSTNNGSSYSLLKTGNFTTASSGSNMTILEENLPASTTYKYKVYIWLDANGGNQASAQDKTLDCELRASIINN